MELTWLGQAGYLLETAGGKRFMIDPYLSNKMEETLGASYRRQVPIDERYLEIRIDALVITHDHADHMDFDSIGPLLEKDHSVDVLTPKGAFWQVRKRFGGHHNYVQFDHGTEYSIHGARFQSVPAAHSDLDSIGVVIDCDGKRIYHTGDTLYNKEVIRSAPNKVDAMLFPINGKGNNMNAEDAYRFVEAVRPAMAFPMHWDLFAQYGCDVRTFTDFYAGRTEPKIVIPEHYVKIPI